MSGVEQIALVVTVSWLCLLTFIVVLLVRQLGLITVRLSLGSVAAGAPAGGLEIGTALPDDVAAAFPDEDALVYLLVLSATCGHCRAIVTGLNEDEFSELEGALVVVLPGDGPVVDHLAAFVPSWVRLIRGAEAVRIAEGLRADVTPIVFGVERGIVNGRALPASASDVVLLMKAHENSDAAEMARSIREVIDGVSG